MTEEERQPRTSFSQRVLIGVGAGIALGLFIGEYAGPLKVIGDTYVGLLQMTVLPYVFCSLIGNIAKLSPDGGRRLIRWAGLITAILWGIGLLALPLLALSFPAWEAGSFFSTSALEEAAQVDFQELYIPSNPFHSLANNLVPAVVLFCILAGAVAVGMPGKERLIEFLDLSTTLLTRLNRMIVGLTPIGVFGIAAHAAGTLTGQQLGLLQGYLISQALGVLLLTFGVLPLLVSGLTSIGYRELLRAAKVPLLTAFVTGSTFVTLPMIVDNARTLLRSKGLDGAETGPDVLVPLGYPFPHLGKLLGLLFVPFAAWFYGRSMTLSDYPEFLATGLFGSFGSLVVAIPMLLDHQELPADIFQLFLLSGVAAARLSDVLGCMHLLAFALLTTCGVAGAWKVQPQRLLAGLALVGGAGICLIGGARFFLAAGFVDDYAREDLLATMRTVEPHADYTLLEPAPNPVPLKEGQTRMERIRERGVLRVGTATDNLPFAFTNDAGDLVGLDVDMANHLARDLEVELELVPIAPGTLEEQLEADHCDLVMAGVEQTLGRAERLDLSQPYLYVTAAGVVLDHRTKEFATLAKVNEVEGLRLAVVARGYSSENTLQRVPGAEIVELESVREFFESEGEYDALVISAEAGSAWTLRHPRYSMVQPDGGATRIPLVYPVGERGDELLEFVDHWVALRSAAGLVDRLYAYWILGEGTQKTEPRWSVARNVLGWVD